MEGTRTRLLDLIPVFHIAEVTRAAVKLEAAASTMSGEREKVDFEVLPVHDGSVFVSKIFSDEYSKRCY